MSNFKYKGKYKRATMRTQRCDGLPLVVFILKHSTQDDKITQKVKGSAVKSHKPVFNTNDLTQGKGKN